MPEATPDLTAGAEPAKSARDIVRALMAQAAGDAPEWSALGLARAWVATVQGAENHDEIAPGDRLADELHDAQMSRLQFLGQTGSRDATDIAAKLAVVVLETAADAQAGTTPGALHRITASALADVVLMGERLRLPAAPEISATSAPENGQQSLPAAPSASPTADAVLLGACSAFDALERHYQGGFAGGELSHDDEDKRGEMLQPLQDAQAPLVEIIANTPAVTQAGILAKARSLNLWCAGSIEKEGEPGGFINDRLLASLLRDLLREPGAAS